MSPFSSVKNNFSPSAAEVVFFFCGRDLGQWRNRTPRSICAISIMLVDAHFRFNLLVLMHKIVHGYIPSYLKSCSLLGKSLIFLAGSPPTLSSLLHFAVWRVQFNLSEAGVQHNDAALEMLSDKFSLVICSAWRFSDVSLTRLPFSPM